ncbi:MAG: hypothetical protein OD811_01815 [Alphaproteobacteria bacterium]
MIGKRLILGFAGIALLAGCNKYEENVVDVREDLAAVEDRFEELKAPKSQEVDDRDSNVRITDGIWVGADVTVRSSRFLLPREFEGDRGIVITRTSSLGFEELIYFLAELTGLRLSFAPELDGTIDISFEDGVYFEGPLSRFLDSLTSVANLSWRYHAEEGEIEFYRYVTRTFRINAFAGTTNAAASAGAVSTTSNYEIWEEFVNAVESMLGGEGEIDEIGSNGYIVVSTTPRLMRRVAEFIEHQNAERLRQVVVNVVIYNVTVDDSQAVGVNFNKLIFERLGSRFSFDSGGAGNVNGGLSASFSILDGADGPASKPGTYFQGSSAIFSALGSLGDASIVTTASLVTLNDQPVPLAVQNNSSYVSGTSVVVDAGVTTSASTTSTASGGINLLVRPRILEDNRVRLTFSLVLEEIIKIDTVSTGSGSVQLPQTTTRNFLNQVVLDNGDTMVLSGYERNAQASARSGLSPGLWVLGGQTSGSDRRQVMVLTVQPVVLLDSENELPSTSIEG